MPEGTLRAPSGQCRRAHPAQRAMPAAPPVRRRCPGAPLRPRAHPAAACDACPVPPCQDHHSGRRCQACRARNSSAGPPGPPLPAGDCACGLAGSGAALRAGLSLRLTAEDVRVRRIRSTHTGHSCHMGPSSRLVATLPTRPNYTPFIPIGGNEKRRTAGPHGQRPAGGRGAPRAAGARPGRTRGSALGSRRRNSARANSARQASGSSRDGLVSLIVTRTCQSLRGRVLPLPRFGTASLGLATLGATPARRGLRCARSDHHGRWGVSLCLRLPLSRRLLRFGDRRWGHAGGRAGAAVARTQRVPAAGQADLASVMRRAGSRS